MRKITATFQRAGYGAVWFLVMLAVAACQDNKVEEVFDKPASERSLENITSLRELLKSSEHGWTASYKPSRTETGYYQFVFRFLEDSVVEMASDFSQEDLTLRQSNYDVIQGSTTKLSFSTFSALHKLSDSNFSPIPGDAGSGLKGDFEFLYYGTNDGGDLIFRTNRTQDTVLFKRATPTALADLTAAYDNIGRITGGRSVYRALEESKNGVVARSAFDFPYDGRVISIRSVIETEENGAAFGDEYITGYGFTRNGIFVDSVRLSNGSVVERPEFVYNEDEARFETTLADGTLLAIGDIDGPILPVDGQTVLLDPTLTADVFFSFGDPDIGSLTTPAFEELYYNTAVQVGMTASFTLWIQLPFGGTNIDYFAFGGTGSVANGTIRQLLTFEDKGDRLVIHRNGFRDANSVPKPEVEEAYNALLDVLTDPEGFYVENLGRATRYTNLVFTFTSVKDPSIRFGVYHEAP
ncbi:DUF4302 domain-containing protein [Dawidia soli]|uniref:DUF4302 domain-containing protein n=1 Tax=Dawidia soli TaxID=2782352 RepID=A0AAP2GK13_9BACT|nr:DUF4302 domain-containing protein [Dawidia soli]MBT1689120.1 DUF4302 domain-containing protein [Dawidia soli]